MEDFSIARACGPGQVAMGQLHAKNLTSPSKFDNLFTVVDTVISGLQVRQGGQALPGQGL